MLWNIYSAAEDVNFSPRGAHELENSWNQSVRIEIVASAFLKIYSP